MDECDRFRGALLGLACGDAVGTAVEFKSRGSFPPLTDMIGGGVFSLQPGEWTDDTSMALCLAASLVKKRGFDARDQMDRYLKWQQEGYMSSVGTCFDIGTTTYKALQRYKQTCEPFSGPTDPNTAGNGSLMRLAPVVLFYFPDQEKILYFSAETSRTTHGAAECLDSCRLFGEMLFRALSGNEKKNVLLGSPEDLVQSARLKSVVRGDYMSKEAIGIRGSGYVVESLEAALWSFWVTESFEQAILTAANLGDDADTTAAICGQIAGAYYGENGIPSLWLERLVMREKIGELANELGSIDSRARASTS